MMSKALLPAFGGSYLVWAACMMFFQGVLLLGYLYVHSVQRRFGILRYARWYWLLLLLPIVAFPFRFELLFNSPPDILPFFAVPYILAVKVGLPFLALATVSLTLQSWFYMSDLPGRENPYVLYSASNLGSILALLTYPVIFEPFSNLRQQGYIWWAAYIVLVGLCFICMPRRLSERMQRIETVPMIKENPYRVFSWFILGAAGCTALLAVTNLMTFDIAAVPFLWVLPLSVYLITFILVFKCNPWYPPWIRNAFTWVILLGVILYLMVFLRLSVPVSVLLPLQLGILFVVCLNCHGRLVKIKPADPRGLTTFYLALAAGGFAGSLLVSTVIPLISVSLLEYPAAFLLASLALAMTRDKGKKPVLPIPQASFVAWLVIVMLALIVVPWMLGSFLRLPPRIILISIAVPLALALRRAAREPWLMVLMLLIVMVSSQWTEELAAGMAKTKKLRNFYGIYRVYEINKQRYWQHGTTLHGRQYLEGSKVNTPLSFYHPTTPAGELLSSDAFGFKDIGMIGLGTGALAAYMGRGQTFTIYELDPDNMRIAEEFFTYLELSRKKGAKVKFVFGDGRISLSRVAKNSYDLLIIDAFSSGSIPIHLLTLEAFEEYFRTLKPDGLLLMHISNRALDLSPVIYSAAEELNCYACEKTNAGNVDPDADLTVWMALCRDKQKFQSLIKKYRWISRQDELEKTKRPWTDDYSNFLSIIRL